MDKGGKSIVIDYGEAAIENEEEDTAILDNTTYLSKLQDRITSHEKIDSNPALKHERSLNTVLTKMCKASKTNEPNNNIGNHQNISSAEMHERSTGLKEQSHQG